MGVQWSLGCRACLPTVQLCLHAFPLDSLPFTDNQLPRLRHGGYMCMQAFLRPSRQTLCGTVPFMTPHSRSRASLTQTLAELNRIKLTLVLRGSYPRPPGTPPPSPPCADHIHPRV